MSKTYPAPIDSDQRKAVIETARAQGMSTEILAEIFWLTNAHPYLIALPQIAENLEAMLLAAGAAWGDASKDCGFAAWLATLAWIGKNRKEIWRIVGGGPGKPGSLLDPFKGRGMTRHPLYSSVWHTHSDPALAEQYRLLQAHMLAGQVRTLRAKSRQTDYETYAEAKEWVPFKGGRLYQYFLGLRHFADPTRDVEMALRSLPLKRPPEAFAQSRPGDKWPGWNLVYAQSVLRGIRRFHGLRPWPEGGGVRAMKSGAYGYWMPRWDKIGSGLYKGAEDPWEPDASTAVVSVPAARATRDARHRLQELLEADDDPQEEPDNVLATAGLNEEGRLGSQAALAWNQVARRAMRNQLLPTGIQTASTAEVRSLLARLEEEIQGQVVLSGSDYPTDADLKTLELTALLNVMIWTGRSLRDAIELRVSPKNARSYPMDTLALASDGTHGYWRSIATLPNYVLALQSEPSLCRKVDKFIRLPDHGAGETVRRFIVARARKCGAPLDLQSHIGVFTNDEAWYAELSEAALKAFDPGGWLTLSRVSQFLFHSVLRVTGGDVSLAALITGTPHALAQTRLYYAMPRVRTLLKVYSQAVAGLSKDEPAPSSGLDVHVGIAASPHVSAVRGLLTALQAVLQEPPKKSNKASLLHYHNCFTLYSYLGLVLSTGARAIKLWHLPQFPVDRETGWTEVFDKGRYKARPAWVPQSVRTQLLHLQFHTERMPAGLISRHSKVPNGCSPCFLLRLENGVLSPEQIGPAAIAGLLAEQSFRFPVNFYRRFMRTELLERQCPAEVVDVWMGHWKEGEEPWGRYSTFSYARYVEELEPVLAKVLGDAGFRPVRSQLRGRR